MKEEALLEPLLLSTSISFSLVTDGGEPLLNTNFSKKRKIAMILKIISKLRHGRAFDSLATGKLYGLYQEELQETKKNIAVKVAPLY